VKKSRRSHKPSPSHKIPKSNQLLRKKSRLQHLLLRTNNKRNKTIKNKRNNNLKNKLLNLNKNLRNRIKSLHNLLKRKSHKKWSL